MSLLITILTVVITSIATALATGYAQHVSTRKIDAERSSRKRTAVGVLLQAELVTLHTDLNGHCRSMQGFVSRLQTGKYSLEEGISIPELEITDEFPVFNSIMRDIGFLEPSVSYHLVYCYFRSIEFVRAYRAFAGELSGNKTGSTALVFPAQNLHAREMALINQVANTIAQLAQQSQAIPFSG